MTPHPFIAYAILDKNKHLKIMSHHLPLYWYKETAEKMAEGNKVIKVKVSFEVLEEKP